MKVLFIGATGFVGGHAVTILKEKFDLTLAALNDGQFAGLPVQGIDIRNWDAIETAIKNGPATGETFDAIVYCATADYRHTDRGDDEERRLYYENCIEVNARGAYHVYEAAWRANVSRVVHIGSMTAMLGEPQYSFIGAGTRDRPNDLYAATKIFGENVGRSYAFRSPDSGQKMKVLCLRLGQPTDVNEPYTQSWIQSTKYCGMASDMRDIALAIECALKTGVQYGVYPIVSSADETYIDPVLYAELGYEPQWKYNYSDAGIVEISPALNQVIQ